MERDLPPQIAVLITKGASQGSLTGSERRILTDFLTSSRDRIDPNNATYIEHLISTLPAVDTGTTDWQAEASGLEPSTAPSVADQVNGALGAAGAAPPLPPSGPTWAQGAIDYFQHPPGAANLEDYQGAGPPDARESLEQMQQRWRDTSQPQARTKPPTTTDGAPDRAVQDYQARKARGMGAPGGGPLLEPHAGPTAAPGATPSPETPGDWDADAKSTVYGYMPSETLTAAAAAAGATPGATSGGDREGRSRDRADRAARRTDRIERESTSGAFADVGDDFLIDYASSPDLAARAIATRMGGGAQTAQIILPQVIAGMQLIQSGAFGGRRKDIGPGKTSPAEQLNLLEEYINQGSGLGTSVAPQGTVRGALKRASRTDVEQLQAGTPADSTDPMAGLSQQIATTNAALLAGSGSWGPGAAENFSAKLDQAALEWLESMATGATNETYPEYLRKKGARRWVR